MSTTTYKGLTILDPAPSAAGGLLIQNNFKALADHTYTGVGAHSGNLLYEPLGTTNLHSLTGIGAHSGDLLYEPLGSTDLHALVGIGAHSGNLLYDALGAASNIGDLLTSHSGNLSNPHQVTPSQLDVYTKSEVDSLIPTTTTEFIPEYIDEVVEMVTTAISTLVIKVRTNTGYVATESWDGAVAIAGDGNVANLITVTLNVPASGSYSKTSPKKVYAWSCTSNSATLNGAVTYLDVANQNLSTLNIYGCVELTYLCCSGNYLTSLKHQDWSVLIILDCSNNKLSTLDLSGCISLEELYCETNRITVLDTIDCIALVKLNISENYLQNVDIVASSLSELVCTAMRGMTSFSCMNIPSLTSLICRDNAALGILDELNTLSSLVNLDVTGCSSISLLTVNNLHALQSLSCASCDLGALNISGLTSLTTLNCSNNSGLTTLRAVGCILTAQGTTSTVSYAGSFIDGCNLTATALNQFYNDLGDSVGDLGIISVNGNIGTSSDDPSLASAKGYTIVGS